jgi:uncharacterized protein YbjT (DUF2867 family)
MGEPTIVITGATGTVGGHVARLLAAGGVPFRALVRDRERAATLLGPDVELVEGAFEDRASLEAAFAGAEQVFLVAPLTPDLEALEANAIDSAARAGVRHLVKLSTAGVAQEPVEGHTQPRQYPLHRAGEQRIEGSGMEHTHLRPGPFMQNTLNFAPSIKAEGVFRGAWGDGTLGYVDVRDVAAVAVEILRKGTPQGALELTGPEALSGADVATKLTAALGRDVAYVDVPAHGVRQAMLGRGMPEWLVGAMVEVMQHTSASDTTRITQTITEVTGSPARSYDDFLRDFGSVFSGD